MSPGGVTWGRARVLPGGPPPLVPLAPSAGHLGFKLGGAGGSICGPAPGDPGDLQRKGPAQRFA